MAVDLHIQVDAQARELAEAVLAKEGVSLDTAVNRYLCAIAVTKHMPYKEDIPLPDAGPEKEHAAMSLEALGKKVAEYSSQDDVKRVFAEIERRYGL